MLIPWFLTISPTATLLLDGDLILRYLDPAGEMLLGASAARVQGKPVHEFVVLTFVNE